jgi:hypothetical protein
MSISFLVIIGDFNFAWPELGPSEADSVLIVDADAVLSLAVSGKGFEAIAWGDTEVLERLGLVELFQLSQRDTFDCLKLTNSPSVP